MAARQQNRVIVAALASLLISLIHSHLSFTEATKSAEVCESQVLWFWLHINISTDTEFKGCLYLLVMCWDSAMIVLGHIPDGAAGPLSFN